ncbi:MAG: flagellar biosynthetic protein FliR [Rhodospirillales bacterium]|nr:flagellar biosynthetic protein FliR [Alphaproteobacteria bacterium]MCB1839256.1 flagellar biosynthetic protein FliR [Alphaproteobacteria bacterium]MCB9976182.1 flagellar biosynthetic protein FliR [Rhodospirillales bacterium]
MQSALETFLAGGVLAFILTFVRIGSAVMIMPGLGDSFVSARIRLHMALGISFVLFPLVMPAIPHPLPQTFMLFVMITTEFIVGLLIGTVARIFMTATDTAGMVISMQSGLSNAQVFNPSLATQGSLIGALLSVTGVLILFETNLHHLLITGLVESYQMFPVGEVPDTGSMAEVMSKAVNAAFTIGVKLATPFIVLTLLIYVAMGVLARLMPQVQVFLLALPIQILLSMILLMLVASTLFLTWTAFYENSLTAFFQAASP